MWAASMSSRKSQNVQKGVCATHEFYVDVSGDSRVQRSDETQQQLYVVATWEDLKDYSTRSYWNFSQRIVLKRDHSTFS
ncbi:hypothetical protein TNCV_2797961 [Trichonephila clavipes]|nr:hypothetical protein TNCV_2797961 [Trichonephila clavipes]